MCGVHFTYPNLSSFESKWNIFLNIIGSNFKDWIPFASFYEKNYLRKAAGIIIKIKIIILNINGPICLEIKNISVNIII